MKSATDELIPTRATLLHRLKDWQDQSSWEDFFVIYEKLIFGVARKAGLTMTEAEEVVQETMITVAKRMPAFNYDPAVGSFKRWLLNVTRWRIKDQVRKRLPLAAPLASVEIAAETPADPATHMITDAGLDARKLDPLAETVSQAFENLWDLEWEKSVLAAAVKKVKRQVDPQKYQVFDFYVNRGWLPEKVAATFGLSVDQVYMAKHRVTEMITEEIKKLEMPQGCRLPDRFANK